jgi:XTP/dITP diphosphohydrolase
LLKLLLASSNPDKISEMQALLSDLPLELVTPSQISVHLTINESGNTYAQNAAIKAQAYAQVTGLFTLGDDSGLEVDAINGLPGIRSARFSPEPGASDADRRAYLLEQLRGIPRPWLARFRCAIALATPKGELSFAEGQCPGEIITEGRGLYGFGYDPIFLLTETSLTMAELPTPLKNIFSHRARAIQAARPLLTKLITNSG